MNDMSRVIVPKSDQLNADDLIGGAITIKISSVEIRPGTEQPVTIRYEGDNGRPWKPCKSMSRVLVAAWGPDAKAYTGRSVTLYRDPGVKWGGMEVGGIRISHMSHLKGRMVLALTATKGSRKPFTVEPLREEPAPAQKSAEPASDRAAEGVRALVARIEAAATMADLEAITSDAAVIKQRGWLKANRPELAEKVDGAVSDRLDDLAEAAAREAQDEGVAD